jgi:hypothetical protein
MTITIHTVINKCALSSAQIHYLAYGLYTTANYTIRMSDQIASWRAVYVREDIEFLPKMKLYFVVHLR